MPSSLTAADVDRIAALAHLELTAEERDLFCRQLAEILSYAEQVQAVDTSGVPPTDHVLGERSERDDETCPSLLLEDVLRNAPDPAVEAGFFRVPRVIA